MTELGKLALKYGSDKEGHHDYCRHYQKHFEHLKQKETVLLELGIGGYEYPDRGGSGLKMWSDFFKRGKIYAIDLYDKSKIQLPARTKIYQGSQDDGDFLLKVMSEVGNPDIIIDDASHINRLTIMSFKHLYPWLKSGGIYVIEDIESSWWHERGFDGNPDGFDFLHPSAINLSRELINSVNAPKYLAEHWSALPLDKYPIESIHFYPNLVIIQKK